MSTLHQTSLQKLQAYLHSDNPCLVSSVVGEIEDLCLPHALDNQLVKLTRQQSYCFLLLIRGYTAKQIAQTMKLSYRTIQHYTAAVYERLGFQNSRMLISHYVYALQY